MNTYSQTSAPAEPSARADNRRVDWVDRARGLGITLVVLGHAAGGLIDSTAGVGAGTSWLRYVYLGIYNFHMPLFFMLAGFFVARRITADAKGFITGSVRRIAYPYFIWSAIQFSIICLMSGVVNHPVDGAYLPQLISLIWRPVSQFWFLFALFFMQVLAVLTLPRIGATGFFVLTLVAGIVFRVFDLSRFCEIEIVNHYTMHLSWFGLGVFVGPQLGRLRILHDTPPAYGVLALVIWMALVVVAYMSYCLLAPHNVLNWIGNLSSDDLFKVAARWRFIPAGVAGCAMVCLICSAGLLPFKSFFDYLGRNSMAIFLTHVLFIAGTRIVILKLLPGIGTLPLMVAISLSGLFGSLLFLEATKRLKIDKVLGLT